MLREIFRSPFSILFLGFSLLFIYPILVFPKGELEFLINEFHTPGLDLFFKNITNLGDGICLAILTIGLLYYNYYYAVITVFSIIIQSMLVSLFKQWIFSGVLRPLSFFPEGTILNYVDGVEVLKINSFPSGHTATAFSLFLLLMLFTGQKRPWFAGLAFALAFCVGFSRVYLLQHFVVDVWFGAFFGVSSVLVAIWMSDLLFSKSTIQKLSTNSLRGFISKK